MDLLGCRGYSRPGIALLSIQETKGLEEESRQAIQTRTEELGCVACVIPYGSLLVVLLAGVSYTLSLLGT